MSGGRTGRSKWEDSRSGLLIQKVHPNLFFDAPANCLDSLDHPIFRKSKLIRQGCRGRAEHEVGVQPERQILVIQEVEHCSRAVPLRSRELNYVLSVTCDSGSRAFASSGPTGLAMAMMNEYCSPRVMSMPLAISKLGTQAAKP